MGNINGSEENQNCRSRSEEEGRNCYADSGGSGDARSESSQLGHQSQRADRTDGEESSVVGAGEATPGGMVSQLIHEFRDQVAARKNDIQRFENEVQRLESKIKQLETFLDELVKPGNS